jgi:long-chain acyl-CoA synthetase
VYDLIAEEVHGANQDLPAGVRVRRFVLLHKRLDADDDEITRTHKVRRRVIAERYGDIINALYGEGEQITVTSVVTYQDGTAAERRIPLRVMSMDGFAPSRARRRLVWSAR